MALNTTPPHPLPMAKSPQPGTITETKPANYVRCYHITVTTIFGTFFFFVELMTVLIVMQSLLT